MFPGAYQHPSSNPTKFMDGSHKTVIYENSCPVRYDLKLDLRCNGGKLGSRISLHGHVQNNLLPRLHNHLFKSMYPDWRTEISCPPGRSKTFLSSLSSST